MEVPRKEAMKFLKWASRQKKYSEVRDRIRAVILARKGHSISEISTKLEYCPRWVQKWVARYRESGLKGLWDKPRSGTPKHLSTDKEQAFIERIFQGPKPGDPVSIFHAHDIQKILWDEFNASYSESGIYALLARLKMAWITSRQQHEFNDPEKMEAWKENFTAKYKELKKISGQTGSDMVSR